MLKIKDSVDLKELEGYGFRNNILILDDKELGEASVEVDAVTKEITVWWENYFGDRVEQHCLIDVTVLFDLINEGLVEKVEA